MATDRDRLEEIEASICPDDCSADHWPTDGARCDDIRYLLARVREAEEKLSHAAQCLDSESDEAEDENARLRAEVAEGIETIAECGQEIARLEGLLDGEDDDTAETFGIYRAENARLRARVSELEADLDNHSRLIDDHLRATGKAIEEREYLRARVEELEGKTGYCAECERLSRRVEELESCTCGSGLCKRCKV